MDQIKYERRQADKFKRMVSVRGDEECWLWIGGRDRDGYGKVRFNRRNFTAHRVAFLIANGTLSDDDIILHSCDNPPCCNPAHLSAGTHARNSQEREIRGRVGNAKLTPAKATEIRSLHSGGMSYAKLAERFSVDYKVVWNVVKRIAWKHVP